METKFENSKWRIQYGRSNIFKWFDFYKNQYLGVFGVTESKYDKRISKYKMADQKI